MRIAPNLAIAGLAFALAGGIAAVRAAPDKTLGLAIMSASVNEAGTLISGAGVIGSVQHLEVGRYQLTFNSGLIGCTVVASVSATDGINPGYAAVGRLPEFDWIQVWTFSSVAPWRTALSVSSHSVRASKRRPAAPPSCHMNRDAAATDETRR